MRVLVIVAGVIVAVGVLGVGGLLAWRWRRARLDAARTAPLAFAQAKVVRAALPLPQERQARQQPAAPGCEYAGGLHLHFPGISAGDVATVIECHRHGR